MSILDKLKELVATIEEEIIAPAPEQEIPQEQEEAPQEEPEPSDEEFPDYVECGKEESRGVYEKLLSVKIHKSRLAELVIEYDRKKKEHLAAINSLNQQALEDLNSLRLEYGVPEQGYGIQFPSSPEDRVIFIKS